MAEQAEKNIEDEKERGKKLAEAEAQREEKPQTEEKAVTEPVSAGQCRFIRGLLAQSLGETLGIDCTDSEKARLQLICDLIDYSRRDSTWHKRSL
ncbi:MAG: hypothetical protein LUG44_03400 [Clostridiales bacterium]|nr:hypothetical protein [Clostridiales bacterium]